MPKKKETKLKGNGREIKRKMKIYENLLSLRIDKLKNNLIWMKGTNKLLRKLKKKIKILKINLPRENLK